MSGPKSEIDKRKNAVRVRAGALAKALGDVAGIVETRKTVPILAHVLFAAGEGRIVLTATDLDIYGVRELASDDRDGADSAKWLGAIKPFSVALPASALMAVVKHFDADAMVTIEAPDEAGVSIAGQVIIKAGQARFKLNALPVADFPTEALCMTEGCNFAMPASQLADVLAGVDYAISTEETRYYLNGVFVTPAQVAGEAQTLAFVATDGHRMARKAICPPDGAASFVPMILPRKAVGILGKLLPAAAKAEDGALADLLTSADGKRIEVSLPASDGGTMRMVSKAIDGTFPDYTRVIPTGNDLRAVIDREALHEALGRIGVMCGDKTRCIRAEFTKDCLTLTVANAELGEGSEELPCDYAGAALTIGFNGGYWREVLAALAGDNVLMCMADAGAPVLVVDAAAAKEFDGAPQGLPHVQVLMPMRV